MRAIAWRAGFLAAWFGVCVLIDGARARFASPEPVPLAAPARLEAAPATPKKRVIALTVTAPTDRDRLHARDRVDVVLTASPPRRGTKPLSTVIVPDVRVRTVDHSLETPGDTVVTLLLDPEDAASVARAANEGQVTVAPRTGASPARADDSWTPRCAGRATVRGIDVSKWQGEIDWAAVRGGGVRFAYIRVSDGSTAPDPTFARNWEEARRAGVTRGAYQFFFFRPEEDPEEQADLLLESAGALRRGDLAPALDVEVADGVEPAEIVRRIERWVRRVRRATGIDPVVYTSALSWSTLTENSLRFSKLALWVAHHDVECPNTPGPWRRWTFHQRSAGAEVPGIAGPVDENAFLGSAAGLRRSTLQDQAAAGAAWRRWKRARDRLTQEH